MKENTSFWGTIVIIICLGAFMVFVVAGGLDKYTQAENTQITLAEETPSYVATDLSEIPGHSELVYDIETRTVYYFIIYVGGRTFMSPYIINGHFCEYRDGEIVEVIPTVRIEDVTN